jgi:hypothetical protein
MDKEKIKELLKISDPMKAQEKAFAYLGEKSALYLSPKKDKKYRILDPRLKKWVDFGQMEYEDFTRHQDEERRQNYLKRATNIKGNWKKNKYSPNNLAINILW